MLDRSKRYLIVGLGLLGLWGLAAAVRSLLEPRLVPFVGTYLASWQFGPFLYLLLSVFFALGGYHIYRRWQAGGR